MSENAENPIPQASMREISAPFWSAAAEGQLVIQRSVKTGKYIFYPRVVSPVIGGDRLEWVQVSGRGKVIACVVIHQAHTESLDQRTPYNIAIVELDEGARMTTNVVGCPPEDVKPGMRVAAAFQTDDESGRTLVQFRPDH